MANTNQTEVPVKRSIMREVVEEGYLGELVSGDLWKRDDEEIVKIREALGKFKNVIGQAFKMFDEELNTRRTINGTDHLKGVEYFRKPRESKQGNTLANDLEF